MITRTKKTQLTRRVTATIYCDEAGFTGNDLLDKDQEVFTFAGVQIDPERASEIVRRTLRDFRLQGTELKGKHLCNSNTGRRAVTALLQECAPFTRMVCHLKTYALAGKFFEYIFEPALAEQNSIFYSIGFHSFISTLLFAHLRVRRDSAEAIFRDFSLWMRHGDKQALERLFPSPGLIVDPVENPITAISTFAMLNREAIVEELDEIRGDGSIPNWVLDLTTTSLFSVLSYWGERFTELKVFCDRSKPLETETDFLQAMVHRRDHFRIRAFGKERQYTFNLAELPQLVDSKQYPGVQIADVFASSIARAWRNQYRGMADATEKNWLAITRNSFLDDNIWPDFDHMDLRKPRAFVNSVLLHELVDRCLRKKNLFEGIPEIIAAAHHLFPEFRRATRKATQKRKRVFREPTIAADQHEQTQQPQG